jgi:hypothetical protein
MKFITLALPGLCLLVLTGCAAPRSAFVPPRGILFTSFKAPLLVNYDDTAVSRKNGEASTGYFHDILLTGLSFAWDDCSLNTAVKNGHFSKVGSADYSFFSVLGVYAKTTVHVHEMPTAQ